MHKRIASLILCFVIVIVAATPVLAEEATASLSIYTAEEFIVFAESCRLDTYSQDLTVTLEKNIDLSNSDYISVPIFSGTFDGKGHIISGLSIQADGAALGLFRYLTDTAVVQNLIVSGDITLPGSNQVGAIAGHNHGIIRSCGFTGSVSGSNSIGGIVGVNDVTGIVENCLVKGSVSGNHFIGGIAGENTGVIRNCVNEARVNTTPHQNEVDIADITIDTLTNTEAVNTVTDIGGIAGTSKGVIRNCKNLADIGYPHMGYNIGGIAGTQSGYIVDCLNSGNIQGRKEIGGIVGQMEPTSFIEYSEDTLQTLQKELGELSGLVNRASGNAQANASQISGQIGTLQQQNQAAQGAVDALLPDRENPELPDPDSSLAALNTLSSSLNAMPDTLSGITAATKNAVGSLSSDFNAIAGQFGKIEKTVNAASENLGGSITDISDADTEDVLTGKVERCTNSGYILADLNAGGIAGAIAIANDLDVLEDWQQYGEDSLNFQSQLRAVILNCENRGTLTAKKQNSGGIVGWQSLGLVKGCTNTGVIQSPNTDYAGGIAGLSTGYIRQSISKCEIFANTQAGGIAGSGTIVSDCYVQGKIFAGTEKVGAILGSAGKAEDENPIIGNYYLVVDRDPGALDGISYAGIAEPMELEALLQLENCPSLFQTVTVRFLYEDGSVTEIPVATGSMLDAWQIPAVPTIDGRSGKWSGLEDGMLERILFDMTFEAVYDNRYSVIETPQARENGLPIVLLEGSFTNNASVQISSAAVAPILSEKETLQEVWQITATDNGGAVRFLLPEGVDGDRMKLLISYAGDDWSEVTYTQNGSYAVFPIASSQLHLAVVTESPNIFVWVIGGAALVILFFVSVLIFTKQKKRRPKASVETEV